MKLPVAPTVPTLVSTLFFAFSTRHPRAVLSALAKDTSVMVTSPKKITILPKSKKRQLKDGLGAHRAAYRRRHEEHRFELQQVRMLLLMPTIRACPSANGFPGFGSRYDRAVEAFEV